MLDAAETPVVGRHGEVPVTGLRVEELHVLGVGDGGLFGVETFVEVTIASQAIIAKGHELPHAAGAGLAIDDLGLEAGFGDGLVDEILRDAVVTEDFFDHGLVFAGALEGALEVSVESGLVGEGADPAGDIVVDDEGKIGLGGFEFGGDLTDEFGIGGEGDFLGGVDGRFFEFGAEAVALTESDKFEGVDGGEETIELIGELGIVFEIEAAGEHGVDCGVEVLTGGVEMIVVVIVEAGVVIALGLCDEVLDLLGAFGGGCLIGCLLSRRGWGLLCSLLGGGLLGGDRWSCGCGRGRCGDGSVAGAAEQREEQGRAGQERGASPQKRGGFLIRHQPSHCKGWTR